MFTRDMNTTSQQTKCPFSSVFIKIFARYLVGTMAKGWLENSMDGASFASP
jgi:hypothetical protein